MRIISIDNLYQKFLESSSVSTDTRSIQAGAMFFALKGPNFNANALAHEALDKGAKYAVVDEAAFANDERILLVEDGLEALQNLARLNRRQWNIPVIGLSGSNGKTTTKELIYSVLSQKYKAYATKGNFNNHIGVPLTILNCPADTEIAIIEMGANHQKEIALLSSICQPSHGLLTNVGKAHLEGFGGVEGVKKGKGELYDYLALNKGTVFLNAGNKPLMEMAAQRQFAETVVFQQPGTSVNLQLLEESPLVVYKDQENNTVQTHLTGVYNFENICMAVAIGRYFGLTMAQCNTGVANYQPNNNRSQMIVLGSNHILLDAYNANPSSMAAAISNFDKLNAGKKVVILGDMFELGEEAAQEHAALGALLATCKFDFVLLAGTHMQHALAQLPKAYYFPDKHGLHLWLSDHKLADCHVLIKGSRGMGLESCLQFLG